MSFPFIPIRVSFEGIKVCRIPLDTSFEGSEGGVFSCGREVRFMLWRNTRFDVDFVFVGNTVLVEVLLGDKVIVINRLPNVNAVADIALEDFNLHVVLWFKWQRFNLC